MRFQTYAVGLAVLGAVLASLMFAGCNSPSASPRPVALEAIPAPAAVIDLDKMAQASQPSGVYRVVAGDVLELQLPETAVSTAPQPSEQTKKVLGRVSANGKILLPVAGELPAAGKTLAEIESLTAAAYYPKYVLTAPTVVCRVAEYASIRVSVMGAVRQAGVYDLHSDERSLVAALTKASGIVPEGAGQIRIRRTDNKTEKVVGLPVKGLNMPFADVALADGDRIEVERFQTPVITVLGLVNKPGVFPYQPGTKISLMQALALAGGVNEMAQPEWVKVYRQDTKGQSVPALFNIHAENAASTILSPGDMVAVDPTAATDARMIFLQLFRVGVGSTAGFGFN